MNPQEQSSAAAMDNELFQMYAHYQLCRVKKGATNSSNAAEKKAIVQILEACQHIHANTFHTLVNDLLEHSVQLEPFLEGGHTALFGSSSLNSAICMNAHHAGKKRSSKDQGGMRSFHHGTKNTSHAATSHYEHDRQYSPGQSGSENSDDEGPTTITPNRKRARSATITDSRPASSASHLRGGKKYTLSGSSKRDLTHMSARPEETKQELFKRMRQITDSFQIEYSVNEGGGKTPAKASFQIHFLERFSPQSINNQCQTNFVAYQIGQIIENEARLFSYRVQEENKRQYYAKGLGKKANTKLSEINKYCKSLARIVNEIGVYCLFMPEVLPPTFYRRADEELFTKMVRRMNDKFPQFSTIASIDENGNLFIADIEDVGEDADETMDRDAEEEEAVDSDTDQKAIEGESDNEMGENLDEDIGETMPDDGRLDIKAEVAEYSAVKGPKTAQDANESSTPEWHTF
ncbi:hypothetical protein FB192DRAFT_1372921 [Mucor lusitanicus]|uniref:Uncharacterized protein n=1 Tax=Mucor circinelloides f. lusitanicus TaxID=29924 RepID=A0A8H4BFR9_MUCCL|nr:hypothetical protein FB192DRAFT_1372921 [Mucor lusitanicus]